jgi:hypothetical protein
MAHSVAGPSYDQEEPLRPKHKHSLSSPALQAEIVSQGTLFVDEAKPEAS